MTRSGLATWAASFIFLATFGARADAQNFEEKLQRLEAKVLKLEHENESLRAKVDDLGDSQRQLSQLERTINLVQDESGGPGGATWDAAAVERPLFRGDGGFIERVVIGGEWRVRGDWRINTTDLNSGNDDEGFRLDNRFNFGIGFDIIRNDDGGESDRVPVGVSTWIEIQAAGRSANNTATDFESGALVSVEDFVTRDNDLDIVRLYQAWILLSDIFGVKDLNLKAGRQEIRLGSQLLMGTNEFFTGTTHDALRLDFRVEELDGDFTVFYAKEASPDGLAADGLATGGLNQGLIRSTGDEDELVGLYSQWTFLDPFDVDLYYFYFNGRGPSGGTAPNITSPNDPAIDEFGRASLEGQLNTFGLWFRGNVIDELFVSVEAAYQFGNGVLERRALAPGDTYERDSGFDAMLLEVAAEWELPFWEDLRPRLYSAFYFAEGPDSGFKDGFSPLFISRHNNEPYRDRHGAYSRFGNINIIPTQNILVFQVGFKFQPYENWVMGMTYLHAWFHHSREQVTVLPGSGNVFVNKKSFGHEVDVYATYRFSEQAELFLNLSLFFPQADFLIQDPLQPVNAGGLISRDTDVAFGFYAQIRVKFYYGS